MKKKMKLFSTLLAVLTLVCVLLPTANAGIFMGKCGDGLSWEYNAITHHLSVSGSGTMEKTKWYEIWWGIHTTEIETIGIGSKVRNIAPNAFSGCTKLTGFKLNEGMRKIENSAFARCSSLISVVLPLSLTAIEDDAFKDCPRLQDVYYAGSEEDWAQISIGSGNEALTGANRHYNNDSPAHYVHSNWKEEMVNVTLPTCTEAGRHDSIYRCSACGVEVKREYNLTDPALGHNFKGEVRKNDNGNYSQKCTRCDKYGPEMTELPEGYCPYCLQKHTGLFSGLIGAIHNILYQLQQAFG